MKSLETLKAEWKAWQTEDAKTTLEEKIILRFEKCKDEGKDYCSYPICDEEKVTKQLREHVASYFGTRKYNVTIKITSWDEFEPSVGLSVIASQNYIVMNKNKNDK